MFLGFDLGTSGLRALLIDDQDAPRAVAEASYPTARPRPGWSEQDPRDWTAAIEATLASLQASHPAGMAAVRGLAISGHMHGAVLLGASDDILGPCVLWNDTRAHAEAAELDTAEARDITGNIVFPGFTAPKLLWLARHDPGSFARVARVMLPKDYVVHWLTGRAVTERSDAAGTAWLDVRTGDWSDRMLAATDLSRDQMPGVLDGTDIVGPVRPDRARALGLPTDCLVVAGGADNAGAACGVGALSEGQGFVSLGTSGVVLAARASCHPAPETAVHTFCHAVPGRWYQMGVTLAATDSLNWLSRLAGRPAEALVSALDEDLRAPQDAMFYPYLSGERTPHNDAAIRAGFTGLDISHGPEALTASVLQGVAFALCDSLDALRDAGADVKRLLAIGGGTRSLLWTRMLATTFGLSLHRPADGEFGAAMGAARLAICGVTGADPVSVMTPPPIRDTIDPDIALVEAYAEAMAHFRDGYAKLKALQ